MCSQGQRLRLTLWALHPPSVYNRLHGGCFARPPPPDSPSWVLGRFFHNPRWSWFTWPCSLWLGVFLSSFLFPPSPRCPFVPSTGLSLSFWAVSRRFQIVCDSLGTCESPLLCGLSWTCGVPWWLSGWYVHRVVQPLQTVCFGTFLSPKETLFLLPLSPRQLCICFLCRVTRAQSPSHFPVMRGHAAAPLPTLTVTFLIFAHFFSLAWHVATLESNKLGLACAPEWDLGDLLCWAPFLMSHFLQPCFLSDDSLPFAPEPWRRKSPRLEASSGQGLFNPSSAPRGCLPHRRCSVYWMSEFTHWY